MIKRKRYNSKIISSMSKVPITVLIGARQVGKTTLIKNQNIEGDLLFLDGQHSETNELFANERDLIQFLKIKLNKKLAGTLIIDEFQMINNVSRVLKILVDTFNDLKILCSGSSSIDIIQEVEESLAGRVRYISANSLSFSESILFAYSEELFKEYSEYSLETSTAVISPDIKQILNQQIIFGGMPRVWLEKEPDEKIQVLFDIYQTYLMRDVKNYIKHEDSVGFNKLLRLLALQIGNLVNVNELSRSTGLSYYKCEEYLYLLEQMFIIKMVEPFESNRRKAIKKMKKVYFLDLGVRNIIVRNFNSPELRNDSGALFENFIFLELYKAKKPFTTLSFYRSKSGVEIDFIVNNMQKLKSVEVKYKSMNRPVFYKGLNNFNEKEDIDKSYVVNLNLNESVNNIHFFPAYLTEKILL